MLETLGSSLQDFARNIRIVDILDITVISIVFYLLIDWLIRSLSKRTLIGFTILLIVYTAAWLSGMYLTELLIQALFIVILIGLVVVFQSDIRRTVDRIGNWNFFSQNDTASYSNTATNIITEAAAEMAENKTGALLVIRGNENWERYINGGIQLNGSLSIPLLYSIFNPTAPGHDGAILLEGDTIVRFGAHLPLSKNLGDNAEGGTRHAAALGISEVCDALVVVISEEQGTISVAQSGTLTKLDSSSELKQILDGFWDEHYQSKDSTVIDGWKIRNLRTAIASVTLAGVLWFTIAYQPGTVYRSFSVPIEYHNLQNSKTVVVQDSLPMQAQVTFAGPEQAFRSLNPSDLAISFDISEENLTAGELLITDGNFNLPNDLRLYDVNPRSVEISAKDVELIQLPVKISVTGTLPDQLELNSIEAEPEVVTVFAAVDNTLDSIATKPIDLSKIKESTEVTKDLVIPLGISLPEDTSSEILISVNVLEKS